MLILILSFFAQISPVIASVAKQSSACTSLLKATRQSINREFCRAKLGKHADACDSLPHKSHLSLSPPPPVIAVLEPTVIAALDAAISFYIVCRVKPDNDKGGNDRAASIARSEATWQSSVHTKMHFYNFGM